MLFVLFARFAEAAPPVPPLVEAVARHPAVVVTGRFVTDGTVDCAPVRPCLDAAGSPPAWAELVPAVGSELVAVRRLDLSTRLVVLEGEEGTDAWLLFESAGAVAPWKIASSAAGESASLRVSPFPGPTGWWLVQVNSSFSNSAGTVEDGDLFVVQRVGDTVETRLAVPHAFSGGAEGGHERPREFGRSELVPTLSPGSFVLEHHLATCSSSGRPTLPVRTPAQAGVWRIEGDRLVQESRGQTVVGSAMCEPTSERN